MRLSAKQALEEGWIKAKISDNFETELIKMRVESQRVEEIENMIYLQTDKSKLLEEIMVSKNSFICRIFMIHFLQNDKYLCI